MIDVSLINTSLVPLNYQLQMSEDGDYPAISATEEQAHMLLHSRPDSRLPLEFRIRPQTGHVPAQSSSNVSVRLATSWLFTNQLLKVLSIQIGVLPNTLGKLEREVLVFLKDIEGCQLALPVSARVTAPDLKFESYGIKQFLQQYVWPSYHQFYSLSGLC